MRSLTPAQICALAHIHSSLPSVNVCNVWGGMHARGQVRANACGTSARACLLVCFLVPAFASFYPVQILTCAPRACAIPCTVVRAPAVQCVPRHFSFLLLLLAFFFFSPPLLLLLPLSSPPPSPSLSPSLSSPSSSSRECKPAERSTVLSYASPTPDLADSGCAVDGFEAASAVHLHSLHLDTPVAAHLVVT